MCGEVRKGRRVEQLSQIISDFPSDLDEYFDRFIFSRIGRSRQNVEDTAAALKLALVVHTSSKPRQTAFPRSHPYDDSYMNFRLLSNGHLRPGFSWVNSEQISQPSTAQMLDQVASYLGETCKDLLSLNHERGSVGFLHRTVFDFLSDKKVHDTLQENAPSRFSSQSFVFDLAKLRCLCLLRKEHTSFHSVAVGLDHILHR